MHSEVVIETPLGDFTIALEPSRAPHTVGNFLAYVDAQLYTGGEFYRVVTPEHRAGFELVQGGIATVGRQQLAPVVHEPTSETGLAHRVGTVSMARGAEPATSEFFVCLSDSPALDAGGHAHPDGWGYAAFGGVTTGIDVLRGIADIPCDPTGAGLYGDEMLDYPVPILDCYRIDRG